MADIFWISKPSILIDKTQISQIWPKPHMSYVERLNAITRLTILLTVLGYLFHQTNQTIMIGIATLIIIILIQIYYKKTGKQIFSSNNNVVSNLEGFGNAGSGKILKRPDDLNAELEKVFSKTTPENPMSNVLLTDIQDNPNKKSAPPAFLPEVHSNINSSAKKMVQQVNKSNPVY